MWKWYNISRIWKFPLETDTNVVPWYCMAFWSMFAMGTVIENHHIIKIVSSVFFFSWYFCTGNCLNSGGLQNFDLYFIYYVWDCLKFNDVLQQKKLPFKYAVCIAASIPTSTDVFSQEFTLSEMCNLIFLNGCIPFTSMRLQM